MIADAAAIVGWIVGGGVAVLAVTVVAAALAARKRPLEAEERAAAAALFRSGLDLDRVRLATSAVLGFGANARALPHAIYFPPGAQQHPEYIAWLMHELTHAWQYQRGVSLLVTFWHALRRDYDYGGPSELRRAHAAGRRFMRFNTEEQGEIVRDYYLASRDGGDTSAYEPFIAELRTPPVP